MPYPEEFPEFIAYYLERPQKDSNLLTVYGLLDSPSVAGAYRFVIEVGRHARHGCGCGAVSAQADRPHRHRAGHQHVPRTARMTGASPIDWRPQIHDSDGLQIWTGTGSGCGVRW